MNKEVKRHKRAYKFFMNLLKGWIIHRFNYEYESLKDVEEPFLLLPNHNLELDPMVVGLAVGKQIYFVGSEHLTRKGFGTWFLNRYFKLIIHRKGRKGMASSIEMLRTMREGNSVCLFPEGNRSFNGLTMEIPPATAKLARKSGAKLVTYRIEGGYLADPRWSLKPRRGKITGKIAHIYEPEELKAMTDAEVYEAICKDLWEDAYATQEKVMTPFKGKELALGIESTVFMCPKCRKFASLHSKGNEITCDCGFRAVYDVYGYITDDEGKKYTVTELDAMQKAYLKECIPTHDAEKPFFTDPALIQEIGENHVILKEMQDTLAAYLDRLEYGGHVVPYEEITGMAIYSRNVLLIYTKSEDIHYEFRFDKMCSALKYLYLFNSVKEER